MREQETENWKMIDEEEEDEEENDEEEKMVKDYRT